MTASEDEEPTAVRFTYSDHAEAQMDQIATSLLGRYGPEIVGRFLKALELELRKECIFLEIGRRAPSLETAEMGRPMYALLVRGGGVWRAVYELKDGNEDGRVDTLEVYAVMDARGPGISV